MNILLLETATGVCSVAVSRGEEVVERHSDVPNAHSSRLPMLINEVVEAAEIRLDEIEAVGVSSGPGSYTGLRIGVSSAKGICYALNVPLVSVPTPLAMAAGFFASHPSYMGIVCPMIDARRMECYTAFYNRELEELRPIAAEVIAEGIYDTWFERSQVAFIGDGAAKTKPILSTNANALYDDSFQMSAASMTSEVQRRLREGKVEDVAYFEPFYLKDFVAKKSVVKGLTI